MEEKKTGAIKIDWFKLKAQFSPNINLILKKNQSSDDAKSIKESIIWFEISSDKIEKSVCKTYDLENNEIIETKPDDISNPWYFDFCGEISLTSEQQKRSFASLKQTTQEANTKSATLFDTLKKPNAESLSAPKSKITSKESSSESSSLVDALKKSTSQPSPIPRSQASAQETSSISPPNIEELIKPTPEYSTSIESKSIPLTSIEKQPISIEEQIKNLEEQLESTRNIILSLDKRFSSGLFNLEEYLEKKNFLIKKIENFKVQIEKLKK
ncbi:MAG: hypothetical protein ACFFBP_14810 [Promethearchaeota archaeon]